MNRLKIILILILVFVASLSVLSSATWLDTATQRYSRGTIGIADSKGSLWRGSGIVQAILPSGDVETLDSVRWTLSPWSLLKGELDITVVSERDDKPVLNAAFSPSGIVITDLRLNLPAALLGAYSPTLRNAGVTGRISFRAIGVRMNASTLTGNGEVVWRDAGSSLTKVYPLGQYRVDLNGRDKGVDFKVSTLSGALNLAGGGRWQPGSPLVMNTTATPSPDTRAQMGPLLRMIGKQIDENSYQLTLNNSTGMVTQ